MKKDELRILQVGNVLVSPDIITEKFCCDLDACKGECCIEGDAGAPVTLDEIMEIENALDVVWDDLQLLPRLSLISRAWLIPILKAIW